MRHTCWEGHLLPFRHDTCHINILTCNKYSNEWYFTKSCNQKLSLSCSCAHYTNLYIMHTAEGMAPVLIASLHPLIGGIKTCNWHKCYTHLIVWFLKCIFTCVCVKLCLQRVVIMLLLLFKPTFALLWKAQMFKG